MSQRVRGTRRYQTPVRALSILAVAAIVAGSGCAVDGDTRSDLENARKFNAYPLYWPGDRFETWSLTHVDVENAQFVFLVYGDCDASGDSGCAPPLQLQISGLCNHLDQVAENPIWRRRRIRDAPVGFFDGAPVMFTNHVQIRVYRGKGSDPDVELRALRSLRSLNRLRPVLGPSDPVPAPAPGVLEGTAGCP